MNRFKTIVEIESQKEYYQKLHQIIEKEYETKTIYPPKQQIFRALNLCDFDDIKVVILGQDPYHEPHQANGLAFSVTKDAVCLEAVHGPAAFTRHHNQHDPDGRPDSQCPGREDEQHPEERMALQ